MLPSILSTETLQQQPLDKACLVGPFLMMALNLELLTAETVLVFTKEALHVLTGAGKKGAPSHDHDLQSEQLKSCLAMGSLELFSVSPRALCPHIAGHVGHSAASTRVSSLQQDTVMIIWEGCHRPRMCDEPTESADAATLVEALKAATKEKVGVELVLHVKPKGEDGKQQVDDLVGVIKGSSGSLGVIQKVHHTFHLPAHHRAGMT